MVIGNDTFGNGKHICSTFWILGSGAAQKVSTKPRRDVPGTPNGRPKISKGVKMEPPSGTKLDKPTNETTKNTETITYGKHRRPGPASQPSQNSAANTPLPTSLRVRAGGRGRSP